MLEHLRLFYFSAVKVEVYSLKKIAGLLQKDCKNVAGKFI